MSDGVCKNCYSDDASVNYYENSLLVYSAKRAFIRVPHDIGGARRSKVKRLSYPAGYGYDRECAHAQK